MFAGSLPVAESPVWNFVTDRDLVAEFGRIVCIGFREQPRTLGLGITALPWARVGVDLEVRRIRSAWVELSGRLLEQGILFAICTGVTHDVLLGGVSCAARSSAPMEPHPLYDATPMAALLRRVTLRSIYSAFVRLSGLRRGGFVRRRWLTFKGSGRL
jgi:hypothetical protein